jgi:hypothetical protein
MNSDLFIEKRSIEELIEETKVDLQYNYIVDDILRDMEYNWRLEYYKDDGQNSYNISVYTTQSICKELENEIKADEDIIKKLDIDITQARLPKTDPNHIKATKSDIVKWDKQYVQAQENIYNNTKLIAEKKELLEKYIWNQYLEDRLRRSLRWLRGRFMFERNYEFLKKGVTWTLKYDKKLRRDTDVDQYKSEDVVYSNSSW